MSESTNRYLFKNAGILSFVFIIISALWIVLSDRIALQLVHDPELLTEVQTVKGWLYIITVGIMLYFTAYRLLNRQKELFEKVHLAQKEKEEQINKDRLFLEMILDRIPVMITRYDPDRNMMFFNKEMETKIGWSAVEAMQVDFMAEVYPDTDYRKEAAEYMDKASNDWREFRVRSKSGEIVDSIWSNIVLDDGTKVGIGLDIRERKEKERKLQKSEEKLRAFFESGVVGTIYGDIHGGIFQANDKLLEIIGYSREEVEAGLVKWDKITPEKYEQLEQDKVAEAQKFGMCTPYEKQYIRKDGSLIWVIVGYILVGEKREESVAFILDIQKQKEYQNEIERRNIFIQTVLDNLPIGLALNNIENGLATYVNKRFEEVYGWHSADFKNVEDFFKCVYPDPVYRQKIQKRILADIETGDPDKMQWEGIEITAKNGQKKYISAKNIPLPEQKIMISTVQDISKRVHAENGLKVSEEKYRRIFETAREGIWIINHHNKTLFVNQSMANMLGYRIEEMTDRSFSSFLDQEDKLIANRINNKKAKAEKHEFKFRKKDGKKIWALVNTNPFHFSNSDQEGILAMVTDITLLKKSMTDLEESRQELRALVNHIDSLLENERIMLAREIHDELGQLLTVLKIKLSLLEDDVLESTENEQSLEYKEQFVNIETLINNAVKNVNHILSRLRPQTLDTIGLVASIEALVNDFGKVTKIELENNFELEKVKLDSNKEIIIYRIIQEAFTNIARHAKSTKSKLSFKKMPQSLLIKIEDNGVGLKNDHNKHGIQYGLVGMRERALSIGGDFKITSSAKGTKIHVELPI